MTNAEAKEALFTGCPVEYMGIEYLCISALILRVAEDGKPYMQVELLDKNKNSVTIARAMNVARKETN